MREVERGIIKGIVLGTVLGVAGPVTGAMLGETISPTPVRLPSALTLARDFQEPGLTGTSVFYGPRNLSLENKIVSGEIIVLNPSRLTISRIQEPTGLRVEAYFTQSNTRTFPFTCFSIPIVKSTTCGRDGLHAALNMGRLY